MNKKEAINHCRFQKTGMKKKSTVSEEVCLAAIALPGIECWLNVFVWMEVMLSGGAQQGLCKVLVGQQRTLQTPTTPFFSDAYLHHVGTAPKAYRNTRLVLRPSIQMEKKTLHHTKSVFYQSI